MSWTWVKKCGIVPTFDCFLVFSSRVSWSLVNFLALFQCSKMLGWSCSNVRSFFQPLVEKCLCKKWSCSNVQKSLVGLVPMFDPFSSRLIAISSVFSPFVPHFSERHARPIGKTNKPKIFKHFAKDFLSTPRTASYKSLSEKSFAPIVLFTLCVRWGWCDLIWWS